MDYKKTCEKFIKKGVSIIDINNTYIDDNVQIDVGTVIYPNVSIRGDSIIGKNNIIDMNSVIIESNIGDNNHIRSSYIENSTIENNNEIGPFSHIRNDSFIHNNITIGNFVEIKKSNIHDGTKSKHLSYLGDAEIFENVNIGAGVITANLNGKSKIKNKTLISDNVYVGANSVLIAPVTLNKNSIIAAGSIITKDVGEYDLAIARNRQINKSNYNKKEGTV